MVRDMPDKKGCSPNPVGKVSQRTGRKLKMEMNIRHRIAMASAATALLASFAFSTTASAHDANLHPKVVPADEVTFQPGPGTLPAGVQFGVLHGNPAEDGTFVLRLKFPAGYTIPPHVHPEEEHVTVISGKFGVGTGDALDKSQMKILAPGSFVQIPAGLPHFAWAVEDTVVQINAKGPFGITYVNQDEDPRIN